MRKQSFLLPVLGALVSASVLVPTLNAAVQNRIASVNDAARVSLSGTISPRVKASTDFGEATPNRQMTSVTLRFNMTTAQESALDQLLVDQQNPSSPKYHQWLTPEQFAAQFGLSSTDLAQVNTWLVSKGLTVTGTARSGTFITVSGSVAQMEQAFNTQIHSVLYQGETHLANITEPALPSSIAAVVGGITGLNDFKLKSRAKVRKIPASQVTPNFTSSISGSHFMAPGDFYTIYDENSLLTAGTPVNGTGITIAVMGQTDISLTDVSAFRSASGLSTSNLPTVKLYGSDPGTSTSDIDEAQLDVEWSGAVAPSAKILYVNSTDVVDISLTQAVDNALAPIITISYGDCEINWGQSLLNTFNQLFKQANAQGQTVVGPAGDSGATDCDYETATASGGLAVDFPASSPYVTGMGGTQFNEGSGSYWNTTNNSYGGSAISYIPEAIWNETTTDGTLGAGGGGASAYFTKPYYQIGTGVPADSARDVPDLALDASADHDGYLICSEGSCTNGYRNSASNLNVIGGTSVATPSFAGILALIEQKIGATTGIGNANPRIYAIANSSYYATALHDVTVGNNDSPCTAGTLNCPGGGEIGFNATTGYDQASGWGSIDVANLVADWLQVTPVTAPTTGTNLSSVTISTTPANTFNVTAGTTVTLSVTVASNASGVSTTPTGTVQVLVDNVAVGSTITLSSGTATYALSTTSLSSGVHQITAAYSGDTIYVASKSSTQIDITSASAADFTLSPTTTTVTTQPGATSTPLTITVAPLHGFTGSVYFTASSTSSTLNATYAFSVTPISITGTGSGTTAFTLYAYATETTTGAAHFGPVQNAVKAASNTVPTWYKTGSGFAVAGLLMLVLPRRRRWSGLLLAVLTIGLIGVSGCSGGTILSNGGSGGSTGTGTETVNASPGTYSITVTAYATPTGSTTALAHNINVTYVVQ